MNPDIERTKLVVRKMRLVEEAKQLRVVGDSALMAHQQILKHFPWKLSDEPEKYAELILQLIAEVEASRKVF
jgi:hypothetical protein